jgi:regulator of sirC expression with transglutaminase-like and TPR domain
MVTSSTTHQRASFDVFARSPDEAIDVALGAALIARDVYSELDVHALMARFDELAGPLRGGALSGLTLKEQAEAVSERFRELGFHGNVENYYDARNSLLPDVLDRKTGIPITLTLVWCEIARRAGVLARGVGFPGHFLARIDELPALSGRTCAEPVIVDPFGGGHVVTDVEARRLLRRTLGQDAEIHPGHFEPATSRATLVRMLTNLKAVWAGRGEHARAFVAIDRIVSLVPDSAQVLRERGAVALRLGIHDLARLDFARVLELEPAAADAALLKKRVADLTRSSKSAPN